LGWTIGRNVRIEYRYAGGDRSTIQKYAMELAALAPDVILASGTPSVAALQQSSRSLPIVFTVVSDPVGAGFVDSLAKPGGNITGFMLSEYSLNAKLLELLKQMEPAANLRDCSSFSSSSSRSLSLSIATLPGGMTRKQRKCSNPRPAFAAVIVRCNAGRH
jgi:ABC-type uncharacterized transport system substrate-binding protein